MLEFHHTQEMFSMWEYYSCHNDDGDYDEGNMVLSFIELL